MSNVHMTTDQTPLAPLAVSIPTAAKQLGISRAYGYKLANSGDLPTVWLGRRRLVPVSALTRLLDNAGTRNTRNTRNRMTP